MNRSIVKSLLAVIAIVAIIKLIAFVIAIPFFMEKRNEGEQRSQEIKRQWKINQERNMEHSNKVQEDIQRTQQLIEENRQKINAQRNQ